MTKQEANNRLNELWNSNIDLNDKNVLKEINQLTAILANFETFDKNYIRIRLLSMKEYNKYIKNETFEGSITKNDKNVWNYQNVPGTSFIYNYDSNDWTRYKQYMVNPNNVVCLSGGNYHDYIYDCELFFDILLDNNNDKFVTIRQSSGKYDCYFLDSHSSISISQSVEIPDIVSFDKNNYRISITNVSVRHPDLRLTVNLLIGGFRPVFQYIDNNKSKNVFS